MGKSKTHHCDHCGGTAQPWEFDADGRCPECQIEACEHPTRTTTGAGTPYCKACGVVLRG